eukprot:CAMPEP_0178373786 /NCGR_PEP_ID=MMETSP0689_2-20121128/2041_1 /TAXON_ID=160604 /ORGANISM="Amphidinium massartii, Strain CS-259" /LENGTH=534 /DNA_ID=CAMNT_0019993737 /DNA_START=12 /DNA_END=1613 /DNA_ORIENTATION=-
MGAGAATAGTKALLESANFDDVAAVVKSLPKEDKAKLLQALEKCPPAGVNGLSQQQVPVGLQLLSSQHCTRSFDASREVPQKMVNAILEAVRSLPTSANTQPWTVIVVQGAARRSLAAKLLEKFDGGDDGRAEYADLPKSMPTRMQEATAAYKKQTGDTSRSKLREDCDFFGAPLHLVLCAPVGPCLKEDPPVDGVFLDMGSLMTAVMLGAHDQSLGVNAQMSLAKYTDVYREVLGKEQLPEDLFVVCGMSIGWPAGGRDPRTKQEFIAPRLDVDATTRWDTCDRSWMAAAPPGSLSAVGKHGLLQLIQSRHCSHTLDSSKVVPKQILASILAAARFVLSAENSQPWSVTVIQGEARDKLSKAMLEHFDAGNDGKQTYKKYSAQNTAQMQKGKDTYGFELYEQRHGLERGDTAGRRLKYRPNYEFWGAPVLLLLNVPKCAVAGTFIDIGSYMMAILLGMHAYGLGGKPLGSVAKYTDICRQVLGTTAMPLDEHLVCGLCIGWPSGGRDPRESPDWYPSRLTVEETSRWVCDADW